MKAIREDEDAARALGKNAYWYKLQALMLGGALGGLAGMILAVGNATVQPDFYAAAQTVLFWLVLILGGVGRVAIDATDNNAIRLQRVRKCHVSLDGHVVVGSNDMFILRRRRDRRA